MTLKIVQFLCAFSNFDELDSTLQISKCQLKKFHIWIAISEK